MELALFVTLAGEAEEGHPRGRFWDVRTR
jgi:hypothetical protein